MSERCVSRISVSAINEIAMRSARLDAVPHVFGYARPEGAYCVDEETTERAFNHFENHFSE
jgi:hypothetical protein